MADYEYSQSGVLVPVNTKAPITGEIATTLDGRDITRGLFPPDMLEPPDDTVLMQRGGGDYSLYREVLRDDHVKAALQQRFDSVIGRPVEVRPGGDKRIDKQAAKFLEEQIEALTWDDITKKMLHGVFYGFAVGEVLWGRDGSCVTIEKIKVRDRRRFGFDGAGRLRMKTMQKPDGELLPDRKFWHFATGADHDDAPYGLGLAHWLYWPVWLKRNGIRFWATLLEKFGSPTAVGKFPPGTSKADQTRLLSALRAIQRDSAIIFPEGMQAELLEATRSGSVNHADFVSMMNAAILVITIGQTASTQGTPGKLGSDKEQADVRADITKADADLVCMSFNASVVRWITDWNFPGAAYPQVWRVMDDPEDQNQAAERDQKLAQVGFKPTLERVLDVYGEGYEPVQAAAPVDGDGAPIDTPAESAGSAAQKYDASMINAYSMGIDRFSRLGMAVPENFVRGVFGIQKPKSGERVLLPPAQVGADPAAEFAQPSIPSDAADLIAAQLAAASAETMADLISALGKMVDAADTPAALQADLLAAYGHLPMAELQRVMELAFTAAELAGLYAARQGQ